MCWRSGKATLSNTDIEPNSAPSWNSTPILRRSASSSGIVRRRHRQALDDDVARVREHQPDQVLDQHALAGPRGAEHDRDRVVGEGHVEAVEHGHPAEALVHVDAADRPVARRRDRRRGRARRRGSGMVVGRPASFCLQTCGNWLVCPLKLNGPCCLQAGAATSLGVSGHVGDFELHDLFDQALGDRFVRRAADGRAPSSRRRCR